MKKIYVLGLIVFAFISGSQAQVTVTGSTGANATYSSLTLAGGAFAAINAAGTQAGNNILINITADILTETGANALNAGDWTTLTINPNGGAIRNVSGTNNGPLIDLNGADNVTINGLNSGGNALNITNLSAGTSASTIRFINDATNNTITNLNILGSCTGASSGTVCFSTGTVSGNDNNTILQCNISASAGGTPVYGIFSLGTSTIIDNSTISVSTTNISDFFNAGIASLPSAGINVSTNNSDWSITNNSFYQTATRTATVSNLHYGVFINNAGSGYTVSNNIIGGANPLGTGTAWTISGAFTNRFTGIAVSAASTATTSIQNNTIANFSINTNSSATTANGNFSGIWVSGGNANIGTVTGNTIGSGTGNGSITINLQTNSGGAANLISYSGTGNVDIRNNTIGSILLTASTAISQGCQAIYISGGVPTIMNNIIGSLATGSSINASTVSTSGTAQRMTGIVITTGVSTNSTITISGNTIANMTQAGTGTAHYNRAISYQGQGATATNTVNITGNTIFNISGANTNPTLASVGFGIMGIQFLSNTASAFYSSPVITGNQIFNLNATSTGAVQTNVAAIAVSNCVLGTIAKNKIYDLRNGSTGVTAITPPTASGICVRAVVSGNLSVYNNMISLGISQTTNTQFMGIWNAFSSSNTNIYYNSINIEGTVTAGALPSFAFLRGDNSATSALVPSTVIVNNIFHNARTGGTGNHYAIGNNYGNGASAAGGWSSNNNVLNSASATTVGYWNTAVNFANWKINSASDALSITAAAVPFALTGIGNLHLNFGLTPTQIESGGTLIAGITVDYDNDARPGPAGSINGGALAPDMGADEFDGVVLDLFAPAITYNLLLNTTCTTNRSFTASASDNSGINVTVGTRPRIYYKRSTDGNVWNDNTNGTDGWKYAEATNGTSPFSFVIDYSLLNGGTGVSVGTTVQYFVVAQDLYATPNVAINSGTFALTPSTVALTAAAFPIGGTINSYSIVTGLSTTLTVGAAGSYTSLTGAAGLFNAINTNGLTGNTTVTILDALVTETGAVALNPIQSGDCSLSSYTLNIKPNTGVTATLTGLLNNNALVRILSSNVTIDGSNNGSSTRDLTITNTSVTSPTVVLVGSTGTTPVTNTTLKNTAIINGANTATAVVISDVTLGSAGYFNNITLANNDIRQAFIGYYCIAVAQAGNGSGLSITGNLMNSAGLSSLRRMGIYVQGVDGALIYGNIIGNFENVNGENDMGIWLASGTINTVVSANIISGLGYTGVSAFAPTGINLTPSTTGANLTVVGNFVSGLTSAGGGAGVSTNGIALSSAAGSINIERNTISDIKNTNTSGWGASGILLGSTSTSASCIVYNNFVSDVAAFGFAGGGVDDNGNGIAVSAGAGYGIFNNTVNMNTNQTLVGGLPAAMLVTSGVTTASAVDLRNNIFANSQTVGTERYAIYSGAASAVYSNIDYNDYYTAGPDLGFIGINRANLAAIQTGFGSNLNSLNVQPNFTSATDLHLLAASNCRLDGYGTPIAGVVSDWDVQIRDLGAPDMGADEFTTTPAPSTMTTASNCDTKNVSPLGTLYVDGSCSLIAKVLPSGGGTAVTGKIKTCTTLDLTQQTFNGQPYVQRHYDIEPTTSPATATGTITLYFTDLEFSQYNTNYPAYPPLPTVASGGNASIYLGNVKVTQFHGVGSTNPTSAGNYPGTTVLITPVATFYNGSFWELTFDVTGFSGFYVHTNNLNAPLPIIVNYLTGRRQGNNHLLNWKVTCATSPRATMTLERCADSRNYTGINTITADAARCNQPFDYTDANPLTGMNYYRLKIVDADGKVTYSTTVALLNAVKGFDIISIAPNPVVTGNFKLNIASAQSSKMELVIFDMQGRLVNRQSISVIAGYNSLPINVANLQSGTYTIQAMIADEKSKVIRFVKQ